MYRDFLEGSSEEGGSLGWGEARIGLAEGELVVGVHQRVWGLYTAPLYSPGRLLLLLEKARRATLV